MQYIAAAAQSAVGIRGEEDRFERLADDFFLENITSPNSRHLRTGQK
jgi:hypothetical protein